MTMELSGDLLRAAAAALAAAPDDDAAFTAATGLPAEALPRVRKALELAGGRIARVESVSIHEADALTGEGTLAGGVEYVLLFSGAPAEAPPTVPKRGRKPKLPELVRVVRKADKALFPPAPASVAAPKPVWPSSPPKHDLPIGRGLFSSDGRRESPRPGVVPVPLTPKPRPASAAPAVKPAHRPRPIDRPRSGVKRSFGGKPGFGAKKSFGGKPGFGAKRSFGGKPGFGPKRTFGGKPASGAKRTFGGKPAFGAKKSFGGKPGFGPKRTFGGKGPVRRPGGFGKGRGPGPKR